MAKGGISVQFDKATLRKIAKIGPGLLKKNKRIIEDAYKIISRSFRRRMESPFANTGGNRKFWPDLADSTKEQKQRLYGRVYPTLVASGDLRDSYTIESDRYNVSEINGLSARFGSSHPLARIHQDGNKKLPAREQINDKFIKQLNKDQNFIDKPMVAAVDRIMRKEFGGV